MHFIAITLHFAIFSKFPRRASAKRFNCNTKRGDWAWISEQFRDFVAGPSWAIEPWISKMGAAFASVLRRIGRLMFPLHLTPSMASDIFEFPVHLRARWITLNN